MSENEAKAIRSLWVAVLVRALRDACGVGFELSYDDDRRKIAHRKAKRWMASEDFRFVCEIVGICPVRLKTAFERGEVHRAFATIQMFGMRNGRKKQLEQLEEYAA